MRKLFASVGLLILAMVLMFGFDVMCDLDRSYGGPSEHIWPLHAGDLAQDGVLLTAMLYAFVCASIWELWFGE